MRREQLSKMLDELSERDAILAVKGSRHWPAIANQGFDYVAASDEQQAKEDIFLEDLELLHELIGEWRLAEALDLLEKVVPNNYYRTRRTLALLADLRGRTIQCNGG